MTPKTIENKSRFSQNLPDFVENLLIFLIFGLIIGAFLRTIYLNNSELFGNSLFYEQNRKVYISNHFLNVRYIWQEKFQIILPNKNLN